MDKALNLEIRIVHWRYSNYRKRYHR